MSNQRYDVLSPRKYKSGGQEKTFWDKVGVAFASKNGDGFDVQLHCVPVPQDGAIRLVCRVPKERDGWNGGRRGGDDQAPSYGGDDSDIPF